MSTLSAAFEYVWESCQTTPSEKFTCCSSSLALINTLHAGFGILGPYARGQGWAPGPISDWKNGATGWILWISLAIMLGDSLTSLSLLIISSAKCSR